LVISINDIPSNVNVLNYNVELRPAAFGTNQDIYLLTLKIYGQLPIELNQPGLRYDYDNAEEGIKVIQIIAPRFNFTTN
jgi:hypothetical protein